MRGSASGTARGGGREMGKGWRGGAGSEGGDRGGKKGKGGEGGGEEWGGGEFGGGEGWGQSMGEWGGAAESESIPKAASIAMRLWALSNGKGMGDATSRRKWDLSYTRETLLPAADRRRATRILLPRYPHRPGPPPGPPPRTPCVTHRLNRRPLLSSDQAIKPGRPYHGVTGRRNGLSREGLVQGREGGRQIRGIQAVPQRKAVKVSAGGRQTAGAA